jgi:hypothetical protein
MNTTERRFIVDALRPQHVRASAGQASRGVRPVLWSALLLVLTCGPVLGQSSQQTPTGQISNDPLRLGRGNMPANMNDDARDPVEQQRRIRQLSAAMHKSIVSDTDKLLKLVTELNAEISNTNPAALSPDQLRKVAAIEKLAHNVRDEMRTPVHGAPSFLDSAQPIQNYPNRR